MPHRSGLIHSVWSLPHHHTPRYSSQSLVSEVKSGNFAIEDEPRSGCLIEVDCEQLKQIIDQDRNVSTRIIALELDVCQKTIINALKRIDITFKFNRWVPHELTAEDKRKRKAACLAMLRDQRMRKF
ncbi:hypothetical protein AVEN_164052-1 [Araneus ventricosus]|uniref:Histone-lysine N-methyltransferase SETMAR n=1 Tax=Araneus ventricosus TaxID=182803 RepID=A0A4Y2FZU9_ARAVE|nr:hypothetical protein AVEN_164052-1 [Araneus ventricosus]